MKAIDAHVHLVQCIAGTGAGGEMRSIGGGQGIYTDGSICQLIPKEWNTEQVTPERILAVMDAHEVERAVLLQGGYLGFQNQYSYEAQQKYPERFLAAAAYDPYCRNRDAIVRHLFGTDTPSNLCHFRYQEMVDTIAEDAALADEQKRLILYENADRVFW